MLTPELDENTEKLSTRARALINAEFRSLLEKKVTEGIQTSQIRRPSPQPQSVSKSSRTDEVRTARKKIREEWEALKNATIISNDSPEARTSQILIGVVAYIEINNVPKSIALKVILESLGATVKDKFTPEVTHVIFKRGTSETFKRARLLNVHLVSVLWIEACKSSKKRIPEELFPVPNHSDYASPMTFKRFVEMGSEERENLMIRATRQNALDKQKQNDLQTTDAPNLRRVTRSTGKSPGDSSDSAIVLRISTDDSGKKNEKNVKTKDKPTDQRRLFASAGDESIDHDGAKKMKLDSKMKRKLFTARPNESTLVTDSDNSRVSTPTDKLNPYQVPGKRRAVRKKNVQSKEAKTVKGKDKNEETVGESSDDSSSSSAERMEQVIELIKMTQMQDRTQKKQAQEKKRRLIQEKKKKKLTKEEKENIRKANKMARRQENQVIKASQPRSCKKVTIYSKGIKNPSLVSTFLHKTENKWLKASLEMLGGFTFKAAVEADTTHVVSGQPVRTINLLKGLARGCWLVDKRWVQDSVLAGHWLTEHDYELVGFSQAVQKCRLERQVLGDDYHVDIFQRCGCIFIGENLTAKKRDLRALVLLCSGKLVSDASCADIVIGEKVDRKTCVTDLWILDSITDARCKSLKKYIIV